MSGMGETLDDQVDLTAAWSEAQAALPAGWTVDSLRCASTGLSPEQRSEDWVARAVGPGGDVAEAVAADPFAALSALQALVLERGT